MVRGFGATKFFADAPTVLVALAALVTQLGDGWFLFGLLGACYWFGESLQEPLSGVLSLDRRTGAFLVALGLGASAVTATLKERLAYPRPPTADAVVGAEQLPALLWEGYVSAATVTGFGFPSGHAIGAVVVYGGLALAIDSRRSYAAAVAVVPLVALSRVVIGVHYAVDVLAGLAVGGAYLVTVWRLCDRGADVDRALSIALGVALVGAAAYGFETMASLGGVLGARIAWGVVGNSVVRAPTTRAIGAAAATIGSVFGVLFGLLYGLHVNPPLAFVGVGVALAGIVAAPLLGETVARRLTGRSVEEAQASD